MIDQNDKEPRNQDGQEIESITRGRDGYREMGVKDIYRIEDLVFDIYCTV